MKRKIIKKKNKFYSHDMRRLKLFKFDHSNSEDYNVVWVEFLKEIGYNSDKVYIQISKKNVDKVYFYKDNSFIEQYAIVKYNFDQWKERNIDISTWQIPFKENQHLIYLGEIPNMHGHCIVSDFEIGKIYGAFHIEDFVVVNDL
jgi:hypothetical protein